MAQISRSELDLIVCSIENISSNRQPCELSKKEQLKQLSDARVAGWKDTLTAKRKAKLTWKAEKERLEEEQRKLQDAEEAALRGKLRNETLQHADNLLRENTEKVRQFRGQQMLVDTLITRDIQIQEREKMSQNEIEEEKQWHLSVINSMKEAEKKSIRDLENEKRRSEALVEDLKRQRDEREEQIRAQHLQKRQEEESIIKKMAMDDLAVERVRMVLVFFIIDDHTLANI